MTNLLKKRLIYIVVGGWLNDYLENLKLHSQKLHDVEVILVESKNLQEALNRNFGLSNVEVIPNFRFHKFQPISQDVQSTFKAVFMSRVTKAKGIDIIFRFASEVKRRGIKNIEIDFYGPINESERSFFLSEVEKFDFVQYNGVILPENVYQTLANYDTLLLPTSYDGEGFPGAIIDAYIAGIPVIASKWKQIPEFVVHGQTGYLFDLSNETEFSEYVFHLSSNPVELENLKKNALLKSKSYSSDKAWEILSRYLLI